MKDHWKQFDIFGSKHINYNKITMVAAAAAVAIIGFVRRPCFVFRERQLFSPPRKEQEQEWKLRSAAIPFRKESGQQLPG